MLTADLLHESRKQGLNKMEYNKLNRDGDKMVSSSTKDFFKTMFFMILIFVFGGAGLSVLFNSKGDISSLVGGFVLIAIAITGIYKLIQNG